MELIKMEIYRAAIIEITITITIKIKKNNDSK